ncbi:MAG TPA: ribonuclease HIII [Rubrobacteraceae bacterium]|nr:ribonuclease HIII [Rubrobacteraceae bacterium]
MTPTPKHAIPKDLSRLLAASGVRVAGHREIDYGTQYRLARGPDTANLNVYRTGRVSVDGKASELKTLLENWRVANSAPKAGRPANAMNGASFPAASGVARLGIDEAGKGEYLGPLVVAGVRVLGESQDRKLREAGVRDSKDLSVAQAREVSGLVKRILGEENFRILSLEPRTYEERRDAAGRNVNRLLGELDAEILDELAVDVEVVILDSFGPKARSYVEPRVPPGVRLEVRPRAEDDAAVAAASILARARYLEEMERLSGRAGFELPRGSTHVLDAARRVYRERGMEGLRDVAKVHFATTEQVTGGSGTRVKRGRA